MIFDTIYPMKIYIAGRTSQREIIKKLNNNFRKLGFEVLDWTSHKNTKPYEKNKKLAIEYSKEDLNHVKNSDIFILLADETIGAGSTTEFGMALLSNHLFNKPKIYIVGSDINNMFFMHPSVIIKKTINEVVQEVKKRLINNTQG